MVGIILMCLTFIPANDWGWVNGWIFIISFMSTYCIQLILLNKNNPEIILNRSPRFKNKSEESDINSAVVGKKSDQVILVIISLIIVSVFLVSGFDHKDKYSNVPLIIELTGLLGLLGSQFILYKVFVRNKFGSKTLDIQEGQKVIDSGPYSIVRHPMYSGFILMAFSVPLLLSSWYALIPSLILSTLLVIRIKPEESMLEKELEDYTMYKLRVKYKLIPKLY